MNEIEIVVTGTDNVDAGFNSVRNKAKSLGDDVTGMFRRSGGDSATEFSSSLSARIGPLLASAPISPPLIAAAAGAAPAISAVVSGAIVAGAAVGATGIGVALASKRAEVQKAGQGLKDDLLGWMVRDAEPIAAPLLSAMDIVRKDVRSMRPEFQGIFQDSARYVEPLTRALTGLGREALPGIRDLVREAEPVIDVLEKHGPRAGEAFSDALSTLSEDAAEAAEALDLLLTSVELTIGSSATGMSVLNKVFAFTSGHLMFLNNAFTESRDAEEEAAEAAEEYAREQARAGLAAARTAEEIDALNQALEEAPGQALDAEQAALKLEQQFRSLTGTIAENGKQHNQSSEKALENREALLGFAEAAQDAARAAKEQTGSQEAANVILDDARRKFLRAADAAGIGAEEARNLADKLFGIPGKRQTDIHVNKQAAEKAIGDFNSKANNAARPRTVWFTVKQAGSLGAIGQLGMAHGGIKGAAAGGARDGLTWVGEHGPELLDLPAGTSVKTNPDSMRLAASTAPSTTVVEVTAAPGAQQAFTQFLLDMLRFQVRTTGRGSVNTLLENQ